MDDLNARIMMYALQSLGFYAEVANYEEKAITYYGCEVPKQILLTNADKDLIITLFPNINDETYDEDQYQYPDAVSEICERCDDYWWVWPTLHIDENDTNTIHCVFLYRCGGGSDSEVFVDVKINQTVRYNSDTVICFYSKGDYPQFSNFYLSEMESEVLPGSYNYCLEKYPSVEHYFQIMKAREFDRDGAALKQMCGDVTCKEVKALGRKVQHFDKERWGILSRFHMRDALAMKFWQNEELKELLLSTGNAILAEAAPRDTLWGIGFSSSNPKAQDPSQWRGKNAMGNMLMYLRDYIRECASEIEGERTKND